MQKEYCGSHSVQCFVIHFIMQRYHKGDHVKIANDYSSGSTMKNGKWAPILSEYAGKEAIVIASYSDQYGTPDNGGSYTLFIKGQSEVSWFPYQALTSICDNAVGLLEQWESERDAEVKLKSDLGWIFTNGKEYMNLITKQHNLKVWTSAKNRQKRIERSRRANEAKELKQLERGRDEPTRQDIKNPVYEMVFVNNLTGKQQYVEFHYLNGKSMKVLVNGKQLRTGGFTGALDEIRKLCPQIRT